MPICQKRSSPERSGHQEIVSIIVEAIAGKRKDESEDDLRRKKPRGEAAGAAGSSGASAVFASPPAVG